MSLIENGSVICDDIFINKLESSLLPQIEAIDVTSNPILLEASRKLVAGQYAHLSSLKQETDDVYKDLCLDGYDVNGYSKTLATFDQDRVSGTVRLVLGGDHPEKELPQLDAMRFFDVDEWPHTGLPAASIGELGRFVIGNNYRPPYVDDNMTTEITRKLFERASALARQLQGAEVLYAIMPPYVVDRVQKAGIEVEFISARLKTEDPFVKTVIEKYDIYWKQLNPALYRFLSHES